jgi:hypothetical protein
MDAPMRALATNVIAAQMSITRRWINYCRNCSQDIRQMTLNLSRLRLLYYQLRMHLASGSDAMVYWWFKYMEEKE